MPHKSNGSAQNTANIFGDGLAKLPSPVFQDLKHRLKIFQGDCLEILARVPDDCVDLIFADPPYFLSNDGITCHAGRMVSVNKGEWDRSRGADKCGIRHFYSLFRRDRISHDYGFRKNTQAHQSEVQV